jgi:phosphopantothenate synthetase
MIRVQRHNQCHLVAVVPTLKVNGCAAALEPSEVIRVSSDADVGLLD